MMKLLNIVKVLTLSGVISLLAGCANNNNYLQPEDFVSHLRKNGIKVEKTNRLDPRPLGATEALEVQIAGSGIGIYKFDRSAKMSRQRLEKISRNKKIFFNGIPYPIYETSGSFMLVGLDKNKEKHRILKVFRKFR